MTPTYTSQGVKGMLCQPGCTSYLDTLRCLHPWSLYVIWLASLRALPPPQFPSPMQRQHHTSLGIGVEIPGFVEMQTPLCHAHGKLSERCGLGQ
jgi:hypothetical protein